MLLIIEGPENHHYRYELENVCRLFLPQERIRVAFSREEAPPTEGLTAIACLERQEAHTTVTCRVRLEEFDESLTGVVANDLPEYRDTCELRMAQQLYHLFIKLFGFTHNWGIVTGVRPVKLLRHLIREEGEEAAERWFREQLYVSENTIALCRRTLEAEDKLLSLSRPDSFSLYVSIPFCPTRCDYCSFVSQTVERAARLIPTYVELLTRELAYTGALAKRLGLRLETVYFGGGTPTTLTAEQMAALLQTVEKQFDLSHVREYTVEAGRPDTVTEDKLRVLKAAGVSRVSINPQTLHDEVLRTIGRRHTTEEFYEAFDLARRCGLDNINTDLIAGLPGDSAEGFAQSLNGIIALAPESITVHTLSMKRASNLVIQHRAEYRAREDAACMAATAEQCLTEAGYHPYYLYRQSRAVGNQANVGWAKPERDGLYNVYIMDETHTILACGAGAVTKLRQPHGDRIERIFNFKFPYEYNTGLEEMLTRKQQVEAFYEENPV